MINNKIYNWEGKGEHKVNLKQRKKLKVSNGHNQQQDNKK